jgi:AraC family transcriptional regulator, transcriptional activator of pobA
MLDDEVRISEFKKVLRQNAREGVVDLDKNYRFKFDFQIHRLEDILRNSRMAAPPNRWSYHRLCFLTRGEAEILTGIHAFRAKKNTFYIIPSRVIASSKNWTADTLGYVLLFNVDFFLNNNFSHKFIANKRLLTASVQPYLHLDDSQGEEVIRILENIMSEKKAEDHINNELIAVKILELLLLGERLFKNAVPETSDLSFAEVLKNFIELLDVNYSKEHSVKFYAEQLSFHPNHLNALIKKHTGLSAKESIQNRILLEAKYLLHSTKLPIRDISVQVGFNDPNYFATFFKRAENMSPVNYRTAFV